MQEKFLKFGVSGLGVIAAYYMEKITPLIWLLIIFETSDYITGILAALKADGLESKQALWGFIKKVCYFFLIGVAFGVDYIISETTVMVGLELNFPAIFGIFAVCYLLSTEAISILENISEFGVEMPFLNKALKRMRDKISEKGSEEI